MLVSTAPSSRVTVASMPRSSRKARTTPTYDVAIRWPARSASVGVLPGGPAKWNRLRAEAERQHLLGLGAGVEQQVAAGDADVEGALADVQRDVARPEVEELDAVLGVDEAELLGVVALAVAGLAQHLGGGLRERSLVGDRDPQQLVGLDLGHGMPSRGGRRRRRGSRPLASISTWAW